MSAAGVSFVIPVYDGELHLEEMLRAVLAQDPDGRPIEVLAVDDGSSDGSGAILERFARRHGVRVVQGAGSGAAAAMNRGMAEARYPLIAQLDQDVVPAPDWLERLVAAFDDPAVAAAQGRYVPAPGASVWARVTGLDLDVRYRRLPGAVDHVCTGNTVYRAVAVRQVGGFDESLGYGYDNDLSYRLGHAGYRLLLCRDARAVHHWPEGLGAYLRQQYGQGYGRLDLVARHRRRIGGDDVSGLGMMLHGPAVLAAAGLGLTAAGLAAVGGPWRAAVLVAAALTGGVFLERLVAGSRAFASSGDLAAWALAPVHLLRAVVWAAAIPVWCLRRTIGRARSPNHSMPR